MDFNWYESLIMGIVTGITEILPVSSEAHNQIVLKMLGKTQNPHIMQLLIHIAILVALILSCHPHILKMIRAKKLARVPKRKRKRPLDVRSLMDLSLLVTMLLPAVLVMFFYTKIRSFTFNTVIVATFLFLNGLILYIPQFLPSSNKDCRSLSRVEGVLMGLGGALFVLPGFSGVGAALSAASVCGVDRKYAINMVLLMQIGVMAGRIILDIVGMFTATTVYITGMLVFFSILAAAVAFVAAWFSIKFMRSLAQEKGYGGFSCYCWGLALLTFILTLIA